MFNKLPAERDRLSRFLLSSCTLDKFAMVLEPGYPHSLRLGGQSAYLLTIKSLRLDKFLASRQIVPQHCASSLL